MTIHLVSTRRAQQETPKRGIWHRPQEPKHERQHPTSKKHPSEGFGIAPKKGKAARWVGQTVIGGNGMGISTKWFFSFVSFHCDRFMNSTSQPLQNGSCDFATFF